MTGTPVPAVASANGAISSPGGAQSSRGGGNGAGQGRDDVPESLRRRRPAVLVDEQLDQEASGVEGLLQMRAPVQVPPWHDHRRRQQPGLVATQGERGPVAFGVVVRQAVEGAGDGPRDAVMVHEAQQRRRRGVRAPHRPRAEHRVAVEHHPVSAPGAAGAGGSGCERD